MGLFNCYLQKKMAVLGLIGKPLFINQLYRLEQL